MFSYRRHLRSPLNKSLDFSTTEEAGRNKFTLDLSDGQVSASLEWGQGESNPSLDMAFDIVNRMVLHHQRESLKLRRWIDADDEGGDQDAWDGDSL